MTFCGNVLELVEKRDVLDGVLDFVKWSEIEKDTGIDIYIEKSLISELEEKEIVMIDAAIGEVKGKKIGMLFIKREPDNKD